MGGFPKAREFNFRKVVSEIIEAPNNDNALGVELHDTCINELRWIYNHFLIFRDKFVVHQTRPFQQSTLCNFDIPDIRICYLVDPVWNGETDMKAIHQRIWEINSKAPEAIRLDPSVIENPNYVLSHLFEYFDEFDSEGQTEMAFLAKENGFSSPSSTLLAHRLFGLVAKSTNNLREFAQLNLGNIKFGAKL